MGIKIILACMAALIVGLTTFTEEDVSCTKKYTSFNVLSDLRYEVHGKSKQSVKKADLIKYKLISDLIPDYPIDGINSNALVEILATCNGKEIKAATTNDTMTEEQKNILNTIDVGADLVISVKYKYKEPVTNVVNDNKVDIVLWSIAMTVVPEKEAEYIGGYDQMIKYLKTNSRDKIAQIDPNKFKKLTIRFTVNENGEINNAAVYNAFGDPKSAKLVLDVINKMPKWKPAENYKGMRVKQDFEFTINGGGDGC